VVATEKGILSSVEGSWSDQRRLGSSGIRNIDVVDIEQLVWSTDVVRNEGKVPGWLSSELSEALSVVNEGKSVEDGVASILTSVNVEVVEVLDVALVAEESDASDGPASSVLEIVT
jgi:hypothetical protein